MEGKLKVLFERGKTRGQIAKELGCTPSTIKLRLKKLDLRRYKTSEKRDTREFTQDPEKENWPFMPAVINFDISTYRFGKWAVNEGI